MSLKSRILSLVQSIGRSSAVAVVALYVVSQIIELSNVLERDQRLRQRPLSERLAKVDASDSSVQLATPVRRLLRLEAEQGWLSPSELKLAEQVYAHAVAAATVDVKSDKIVQRSQALEFLQAVGRYIERHYIYQNRTSLGRGLIHGVLDCDLRVLLYLSIAAELGLENFYFVLAPGHSLVAWQQDDAAPLLWETTKGAGDIADLSNRQLYATVNQKTYGDYMLASDALVESQITAMVGWLWAQKKDPQSNRKAIELFQTSLEQFPSANHAAAIVMLSSDNLLKDMPLSSAYEEYAKTYPTAIGTKLYRLAVMLSQNSSHSDEEVSAAVQQVLELQAQGVDHVVMSAVIERYGNLWQKFDNRWLQPLAVKLGKILYPSSQFVRERDRTAEGRAFIFMAIWLALLASVLSLIVTLYKVIRHALSEKY